MATVDQIPELTLYAVTATFRDVDGDLVTPEGEVSYQLVDAGTGGVVIEKTVITVTGSSVTITVPAAANECITAGTRAEYKQLVITAEGLAQVEHLYRVVRVPAPA